MLLTGNHQFQLQLIDLDHDFYSFSYIWTTISNTNHLRPAIKRKKNYLLLQQKTFDGILLAKSKQESVKCNFPLFFLEKTLQNLPKINIFIWDAPCTKNLFILAQKMHGFEKLYFLETFWNGSQVIMIKKTSWMASRIFCTFAKPVSRSSSWWFSWPDSRVVALYFWKNFLSRVLKGCLGLLPRHFPRNVSLSSTQSWKLVKMSPFIFQFLTFLWTFSSFFNVKNNEKVSFHISNSAFSRFISDFFLFFIVYFLIFFLQFFFF